MVLALAKNFLGGIGKAGKFVASQALGAGSRGPKGGKSAQADDTELEGTSTLGGASDDESVPRILQDISASTQHINETLRNINQSLSRIEKEEKERGDRLGSLIKGVIGAGTIGVAATAFAGSMGGDGATPEPEEGEEESEISSPEKEILEKKEVVPATPITPREDDGPIEEKEEIIEAEPLYKPSSFSPFERQEQQQHFRVVPDSITHHRDDGSTRKMSEADWHRASIHEDGTQNIQNAMMSSGSPRNVTIKADRIRFKAEKIIFDIGGSSGGGLGGGLRGGFQQASFSPDSGRGFIGRGGSTPSFSGLPAVSAPPMGRSTFPGGVNRLGDSLPGEPGTGLGGGFGSGGGGSGGYNPGYQQGSGFGGNPGGGSGGYNPGYPGTSGYQQGSGFGGNPGGGGSPGTTATPPPPAKWGLSRGEPSRFSPGGRTSNYEPGSFQDTRDPLPPLYRASAKNTQGLRGGQDHVAEGKPLWDKGMGVPGSSMASPRTLSAPPKPKQPPWSIDDAISKSMGKLPESARTHAQTMLGNLTPSEKEAVASGQKPVRDLIREKAPMGLGGMAENYINNNYPGGMDALGKDLRRPPPQVEPAAPPVTSGQPNITNVPTRVVDPQSGLPMGSEAQDPRNIGKFEPSGGPGENPSIAAMRKPLMDAIRSDPAQYHKFQRLMKSEGDYQATMEALVNRTAMTKGSIWGEMHSGFYGPVKRNSLQNINARDKAKIDAAFDKVYSGSNIIQGRNNQGLPSDPGRHLPDDVRIPGSRQRFGLWTGKRGGEDYSQVDSRKFSKRLNEMARADQAARTASGTGASRFVQSPLPPQQAKPITGGQVFHDGGNVIQKQASLAGVRKGALQPSLVSSLEYAGLKTGFDMEVYSGGQRMHGAPGKVRGSSDRHNMGRAADFRLLKNGKLVTDPKEISRFIEHATRGGIKGIGYSPKGYMGPGRIHMDVVREGTWGANRRSRTTPPFVLQAYKRGKENRLTREQMKAEVARMKEERKKQQEEDAKSIREGKKAAPLPHDVTTPLRKAQPIKPAEKIGPETYKDRTLPAMYKNYLEASGITPESITAPPAADPEGATKGGEGAGPPSADPEPDKGGEAERSRENATEKADIKPTPKDEPEEAPGPSEPAGGGESEGGGEAPSSSEGGGGGDGGGEAPAEAEEKNDTPSPESGSKTYKDINKDTE